MRLALLSLDMQPAHVFWNFTFSCAKYLAYRCITDPKNYVI
jgi:hypothetical protein